MPVPVPPSIADRPHGTRVAGKVVILTGGSAGIGRAGAELLAREGARVVVSSRTSTRGEDTVGAICAAGGDARYIQADVSREADCVRLVEETLRAYGRLDVLINNAAVYPRATLGETTIAFWREIM